MTACTGPIRHQDGGTDADTESVTQRVAAALVETGVIIPELGALDEHLRPLVVDADGYELTADNLRSALGITGDVSLDNVQQNQTVYNRCLTDLPDLPGGGQGRPRHQPRSAHLRIARSKCSMT